MRVGVANLSGPLAAGLIALVVTGPAIVTLASIPPTRPVRTWMMREPSTLPPHGFQLPHEAAEDGTDVFRVTLSSQDVADFAANDRVEIAFGTNRTSPRLANGTLRITGTSCRYVTPPGSPLLDNELLAFIREGRCQPLDGAPVGQLELEMRIARGTGSLALWTFEDASAAARPLYLHDGSFRLSVRGWVSRSQAPFTMRRAELLAYLWSVRVETLWTRLAFAVAFILAGVWILQRADRASARAPGVGAAVGTALLMGGLALVYAVLAPPLQAPDEPDHLESYAELTEGSDISAELKSLMERTHFERLRHQAFEQFSDHDVDHPLVGPVFEDLIREPVATRSPTTAWWWQRLHGVMAPASLVSTLWGLREGAALLFGAAAGVAVLLLGRLTAAPRPALLGLGMLMVPTLPFFGGHVSDTSTIVAINLLLAATLAGLVLDSPHDLILGASLGSTIALVLLSGRRSWPILVVVGTALLARAALGSPKGRSLARTAAFWAPLVATLGLGVWWAGRLGTLGYALRSPSAQVPAALAPFVSLLQRPLLLLVPLLALPFLEQVGGPIRQALVALGSSRLARWAGTLVAAAVVLSAGASYWLDLPTAHPGAVHTASLVDYVTSVLLSMAVPFRIGHSDLLLSTLFWSGFGWVDTVAPPWLLAILNAATAVAVWLIWRQTIRTRDPRRIVLVGALGVGLAVSLAFFAAGAYALKYDLYGRYVVAWYLMLVVFVWLAPALGSKRAWWLWAALPLAAHAYCLQMLVARYF